MNAIKKMGAIALTAAVLSTAAMVPAEAGWRGRLGNGLAVGLIGGAILGAASANSAPVYRTARPVYAEVEDECFRRVVGHTYSGRPIIRTVCE